MAITFGENAPFRCDIVGSFLRPDVLKQARADFEAGAIDANQLKTVEDIAIRDLVAKQKAAGFHTLLGVFHMAVYAQGKRFSAL